MKRLSVPAVLIVLMSAAGFAPAAAEVPSLAGKWRPDLQRSTSEKTLKPAANDPNAVAPPAPTPEQAGHPLEVIEQSEKTVKITLHDPEGEPTNTLVLSLKGEETTQDMSAGALQYVSRSHWEGESLVVEWRILRDGKPMIGGKDVRTLEGPGTQRLVRDLEDAKSRTHSVILDTGSSWSLRYDHERGAAIVTSMPAGEFKTHCLQVMETVRRRRETVVITKRGVPVAKLVPVDLPQPHKVFGCLAQRYEEVGDIVSPVLPPEAWDVLK